MERTPTATPPESTPRQPRNSFGLGLLGGFGLTVLGIVLSIVMLSLSIGGEGGLIQIPLYILGPGLVLAILRGTQHLWHRFWGVVAGVLLAIMALIGVLMVVISNMNLGGF